MISLQTGDTGQLVKWLQHALGNVGADGIFGPKTFAELQQFQVTHGLHDDGIAGEKSFAILGIKLAYGCDLSHFQGTVDCAAIDQEFVQLKATQGLSYVDPTFAERAAALRVPAGGYAYVVNSLDAARQALHLWQTAGFLPLRPWIDYETNPANFSPAQFVQFAYDFCAEYQLLSTKLPILYIPLSLIRYGGKLWQPVVDLGVQIIVPRYGGASVVDCGDVSPWPSWLGWQFSASGTVAGVDGHCDLDVVCGGVDALR